MIEIPKGIRRLSRMFCGCCSAEGTYGEILKELERCERAEFLSDDGLAAALCAYLDLTEHGSSVRGAWLTPDGDDALVFLRKHGIDWRDGNDEIREQLNEENANA